jgi:hypothetical protein
MSRGPGRIERAIEALFRERGRAYRTSEIAHLVYGEVSKSRRVAVLRAAKRVAERARWDWTCVPLWQGFEYVFYDPRDRRSRKAAGVRDTDAAIVVATQDGDEERAASLRARRYDELMNRPTRV